MIADTLLSGMKAAQTQVVQSAERIVSQTAQPQTSFENSLSDATTQNAPVQRASLSEPVVSADTLVQNIVSMDVASAAYRANISAIKAWDDMTKAALSVKPTDEKV